MGDGRKGVAITEDMQSVMGWSLSHVYVLYRGRLRAACHEEE